MRHYTYIDLIDYLPPRTFAWFHGVRCRRLLKQLERNDPARLAVLYAQVHARKGLVPW